MSAGVSVGAALPHQVHKPDQSVIEGRYDVAVLDEPLQALLVEGLGSYKVKLLAVALVKSRTPERTTQCTKHRIMKDPRGDLLIHLVG